MKGILRFTRAFVIVVTLIHLARPEKVTWFIVPALICMFLFLTKLQIDAECD